ncbi:unnamed protein product [Rhodiola kirilowii]
MQRSVPHSNMPPLVASSSSSRSSNGVRAYALCKCDDSFIGLIFPFKNSSSAMLHPPLELSNTLTPIGTSISSTTMALATRPLPGINIPTVKPVHTNSMSQPLPILATISATSGPSLNTFIKPPARKSTPSLDSCCVII